jgi:rubrerythrin
MVVQAAAREEAASPLVAGVRVKGEYRCAGCGYGVTVYTRLPRCPMCGAGSWEQLDWAPFRRATTS